MERKKALKKLADLFVNEINQVLDGVVAKEVQDRIARLAKGVGTSPMRGRLIQKPCTVVGCKLMGAARYGSVCIEHAGKYTREEKLVLRDRAKQPGGKWAKAEKKSKKAAG